MRIERNRSASIKAPVGQALNGGQFTVRQIFYSPQLASALPVCKAPVTVQ